MSPLHLYRALKDVSFNASVCLREIISIRVRFTNDDPWLVKYIDKYARVVELAGMGFISDFIPALKFLDREKLKGFRDTTDAFNAMLKDEFEDHRQHFDASKRN